MVALKKALDSLATNAQEVIMLDDFTEFSDEVFSNSIVFGNINLGGDGSFHIGSKMPLMESTDYIIHDHNPGKFGPLRERYSRQVENGRCIFYRVFREYSHPEEPFEKILDMEAHEWSESKKMLSIPWATNLLPNEFPDKLPFPAIHNRDVVFVGTIWGANEGEISELAIACTNHGLRFVHYGKNFRGYQFPKGVNAISSQEYISEEEHQKVISQAFLAPAIQGNIQIGNTDPNRKPSNGSYIPCRLLKNVSYSSLPVSNNLYVKPFLEGNAIVSEDIGEMIRLSVEIAENNEKRENMIRKANEIIRHRHTYVSRIGTMLQALELSKTR